MASEKTQCTPGNRDPSSSHRLRAMHSLRNKCRGFEPGGLEAKVRTPPVRVVAVPVDVGQEAAEEEAGMRTRGRSAAVVRPIIVVLRLLAMVLAGATREANMLDSGAVSLGAELRIGWICGSFLSRSMLSILGDVVE